MTTRASRLIVLCLLMATAGAGVLLAREAACPAKSGTNWLRHYTEACDVLRTAAQDCTLCHDSVTELNAYGVDLAAVGNLPWLVEDLDSDGDGRTNLEEIGDCTLPGDAKSVPLAPTTLSALRFRWR